MAATGTLNCPARTTKCVVPWPARSRPSCPACRCDVDLGDGRASHSTSARGSAGSPARRRHRERSSESIGRATGLEHVCRVADRVAAVVFERARTRRPFDLERAEAPAVLGGGRLRRQSLSLSLSLCLGLAAPSSLALAPSSAGGAAAGSGAGPAGWLQPGIGLLGGASADRATSAGARRGGACWFSAGGAWLAGRGVAAVTLKRTARRGRGRGAGIARRLFGLKPANLSRECRKTVATIETLCHRMGDRSIPPNH